MESFQNPDWLRRKAVLVEASAAPALMAMAMAVTDHAAAGSPHVFRSAAAFKPAARQL